MLILSLLAVRATRVVHAAALNYGAEVIDAADCSQVVGEVIGAAFGYLTHEESDRVWTAVESKSKIY